MSAPLSHPPRTSPHDVIEVSRSERIASMLLTLLILIGSVAFCFLAAWLSRRIFDVPPLKLSEIRIEQVGDGTSDRGVGENMQLDSPTYQDINRESSFTEPSVQDTLSALLDTVSDAPGNFDNPEMTGTDTETSPGSRRRPKTGPGRPGIPPELRWEIRFDEGSTVEDYARILDYFHIELGVLNGAGQVVYLTNLTKPKPDTRTGTSKDEFRQYMSWRQGKMREADDELLRRAGVPKARHVLQFFSKELEEILLALEFDFQQCQPGTIRKTRFAIKMVGNGYEFYVTDQTALVKSS
jgi:hypothetical protein